MYHWKLSEEGRRRGGAGRFPNGALTTFGRVACATRDEPTESGLTGGSFTASTLRKMTFTALAYRATYTACREFSRMNTLEPRYSRSVVGLVHVFVNAKKVGANSHRRAGLMGESDASRLVGLHRDRLDFHCLKRSRCRAHHLRRFI